MRLTVSLKCDSGYAHFSVLGTQEENWRLEEVPGTSREFEGTLRKGTDFKERVWKSRGGVRAQRKCLEAKEILGIRNQTPEVSDKFWGKKKLGSPGDQKLGSIEGQVGGTLEQETDLRVEVWESKGNRWSWQCTEVKTSWEQIPYSAKEKRWAEEADFEVRGAREPLKEPELKEDTWKLKRSAQKCNGEGFRRKEKKQKFEKTVSFQGRS